MTGKTLTPLTESELQNAEQYHIPRDGDRDLSFRGLLVGSGRHGSGGNSGFCGDWTRGVDAEIYVTAGGKIVLHRHYWSKWQGEGDRHEATVCTTAGAALDWLCDDDGQLRVAEKEAWRTACHNVAELAGEDYEVIA